MSAYQWEDTKEAWLRYCPTSYDPIAEEMGMRIPLTFEWQLEGNQSLVYVARLDLIYAGVKSPPNEGQVLQCGAYRVRILEIDFMKNGYICVKENWLGIPRLYSRKLEHFYNAIKWRVLMTLKIWGLRRKAP